MSNHGYKIGDVFEYTGSGSGTTGFGPTKDCGKFVLIKDDLLKCLGDWKGPHKDGTWLTTLGPEWKKVDAPKRPMVGDKYLCLGKGIQYNGVYAGVVCEVTREDTKEQGGKFGVLWNPKMDAEWTFGPSDSDEI